MEVSLKGQNLILTGLDSFNLSHIFDCGQCFRWNRNADGSFFGIAMGKALKISENDENVIFHNTSIDDFNNIWKEYFDFNTSYSQIKKELSVDKVLKEAIGYGDGIRILKQDLWECVVSFIISASNNIPRIKKIVEALCYNFGEKISYMDEVFYSFPGPEKINSLTLEDLSVIKAGFRDKYILDAAEKFVSGEISYDMLKKMSAEDAKKTLMTVKGIGNKVADCIVLFGLSKCESFPIDVWIKRIMEYCYFEGEEPIGKISEFAKEKFGSLGGYAQQYLFFYARENKIGL